MMNQPIHIAINRTVKPGYEGEFEKAVLSFFADAQENEATLGAQLLRPLPGSNSRSYGILRSFDSEQDRDAFYASDRFQEWERAVAPLVEDNYSRKELTGLEAFFTDPSRMTQPPLWKMAIVTWLGVWPTVFAVTSLGGRWLLSGWPFWLAVGIETIVVVAILTWGVMPLLTRWFKSWLISSTGSAA
jgi:antibiotic biosynthesis monooxygenase (ABM) superfamily enzyme